MYHSEARPQFSAFAMPWHQCSECSKSFNRANLLREHARVHTGEKPHLCEACHRAFARPSDLWQHKKTHGALSHLCQAVGLDGATCTAGFHRERGLVRHRRTCKVLRHARDAEVQDRRERCTSLSLVRRRTSSSLNDPSQSCLLSHDAHINRAKCLWRITSELWLALVDFWTVLGADSKPESPTVDTLATNLVSVISRPSLGDQTILWSSAILLVQSRLYDGSTERHHHLDYIGSVKSPWSNSGSILDETDVEDIGAVINTLLCIAQSIAAQAKLYLVALDEGDIV